MFVSKLFHFRYSVPKVLCCQTVNLFQNLSLKFRSLAWSGGLSQEDKHLNMSRQQFGIRHARPGGNTVHAELHTNERVTTGHEGSQVVRDHDWTDLESKMVDLALDCVVGKVGKVLPIC